MLRFIWGAQMSICYSTICWREYLCSIVLSLVQCQNQLTIIFKEVTSLVAQMVKHLAYNVGDLGFIPGSGRSSGEGNGNPLQYSCLENPMDREAWWATVHGVAKSGTWLSDFTFTFTFYLLTFIKSLFSQQQSVHTYKPGIMLRALFMLLYLVL